MLVDALQQSGYLCIRNYHHRLLYSPLVSPLLSFKEKYIIQQICRTWCGWPLFLLCSSQRQFQSLRLKMRALFSWIICSRNEFALVKRHNVTKVCLNFSLINYAITHTVALIFRNSLLLFFQRAFILENAEEYDSEVGTSFMNVKHNSEFCI